MEGGETAPAVISAVLEASAGTHCPAHREGRPCGVSQEQTAAEPQQRGPAMLTADTETVWLSTSH